MEKNLKFEPQSNRFTRYTRMEWEICRKKAQAYLLEHPKPKYYKVIGGTSNPFRWHIDEDGARVGLTYITYSIGEVTRIKSLVLSLWNQMAEPANAYEEIKQNDFSFLHGKNKELDELLWNRAEKDDVNLQYIDFDTPLSFYRFSTYEFDLDNFDGHKLEDQEEQHMVCITDEQYIYLLTETLYESCFSFNDLVRYNAPFAQELLEMISHGMSVPAMIMFDEVRDDAKMIKAL